jgi:hypothetical protein
VKLFTVKLRLLSIFICLLPAGCSFSAPQAESAWRLINGFASGTDEGGAAKQPIWLASVGETGAVVKPYASGGFTVFANADGNAIAFDGWIVRSITGFGLEKPLSVAGKEGKRSFAIGDEVSSANCRSWEWRAPVWRQSCDIGPSTISLDGEGNIQEISMSLGEKLGFVTLRVAD